jgi:hypothetical protein
MAARRRGQRVVFRDRTPGRLYRAARQHDGSYRGGRIPSGIESLEILGEHLDSNSTLRDATGEYSNRCGKAGSQDIRSDSEVRQQARFYLTRVSCDLVDAGIAMVPFTDEVVAVPLPSQIHALLAISVACVRDDAPQGSSIHIGRPATHACLGADPAGTPACRSSGCSKFCQRSDAATSEPLNTMCATIAPPMRPVKPAMRAAARPDTKAERPSTAAPVGFAA